MSSGDSPTTQQPSVYHWLMGILKEHYGSIFALVASLASLAGIVNLGVYTHYIGRSDVFMPSLDLGPGLILLLLTYIIFFVLLIGSMLASSLLFAVGLGELRPKPAYTASIVRTLGAITGTAMLGVMLPMVLATYQEDTPSLWWVCTVFVPPGLCSWFFIKGNIGKAERLGEGLTSSKTGIACVVLTGLVAVTALSGIYPAWVITGFYREAGSVGGTFVALFFCFVAMLGSLAPVMCYYTLSTKGKGAQLKGGIVGFVIFLALVTFMVPSLLTLPAVVAVKFLGINDRKVSRYLVSSEEYPADSLNAGRWSVERSQEKKFMIQGFPLYAYGSIILLCPAGLVKVSEKDIDKYSGQCVPFAKGFIRQLDRVVATDAG